ncbi:MAG: Uma2 family endonuclease [Aggregatilineales bacterium]
MSEETREIVTTLERIQSMSLREFERRYDQDGPFELINGEIKPISPTKSRHSVVTRTVFLVLHQYCTTHGLGEVFSETVFVLTDSRNWVKDSFVPDVLFFSAGRLATYKTATPDWADKPFVLVPELVVEVLSPTDRTGDVLEKVAAYLKAGVFIVLVIDAEQHRVVIYRANSTEPRILIAADMLDGIEAIPGFALPVAALFADL